LRRPGRRTAGRLCAGERLPGQFGRHGPTGPDLRSPGLCVRQRCGRPVEPGPAVHQRQPHALPRRPPGPGRHRHQLVARVHDRTALQPPAELQQHLGPLAVAGAIRPGAARRAVAGRHLLRPGPEIRAGPQHRCGRPAADTRLPGPDRQGPARRPQAGAGRLAPLCQPHGQPARPWLRRLGRRAQLCRHHQPVHPGRPRHQRGHELGVRRPAPGPFLDPGPEPPTRCRLDLHRRLHAQPDHRPIVRRSAQHLLPGGRPPPVPAHRPLPGLGPRPGGRRLVGP
ncbi:hypothetical protein KXX11_003133, partial [Aspergillus fumigatus]